MAEGRPRPLKDLAAAISFLTILPVRSEWPDGEVPRATGWYPWVGWILGGLAVLGVNWGISLVDHPPVATGAILLGALVIGGWAALTRFLHWDGLADTFDGVLGGDTPERRLEIMRDSRVGAFGVSAMIFLAFIQFAAVTDAISDRALWVLAVAPVCGRIAAATSSWYFPAARTDGLAATTAFGHGGVYERLVAGAALIAIAGLVPLGAPVRPLMWTVLAAVIAELAVPRILARRVGGMTGDVLGATVLIVETVALVTGAVLA
jgi:adenosylcobinamide-GDP ribazoletransferase